MFLQVRDRIGLRPCNEHVESSILPPVVMRIGFVIFALVMKIHGVQVFQVLLNAIALSHKEPGLTPTQTPRPLHFLATTAASRASVQASIQNLGRGAQERRPLCLTTRPSRRPARSSSTSLWRLRGSATRLGRSAPGRTRGQTGTTCQVQHGWRCQHNTPAGPGSGRHVSAFHVSQRGLLGLLTNVSAILHKKQLTKSTHLNSTKSSLETSAFVFVVRHKTYLAIHATSHPEPSWFSEQNRKSSL